MISIPFNATKLLLLSSLKVFASENRDQIDTFLEKQDGQWTLEEDRCVFPAESNFDGFYMARLSRP